LRQDFIVSIAYQQNSTWQGTVTWINKNKKENFRSALELIRMIDSTLMSQSPADKEGAAATLEE